MEDDSRAVILHGDAMYSLFLPSILYRKRAVVEAVYFEQV